MPFEDWIEAQFQAVGWRTRRSNGARFDIEMTRWFNGLIQQKTVECKDQPASVTTLNYFLEEKAIMRDTTADFLVTGFVHDAYLMAMESARQLFREHRKTHGGDYFEEGEKLISNPGAVVPKTEFIDFYHFGH